MKHFKRRCKDTRQIAKELFELVTLKNFIVVIPGILLFMPIIIFWMLFEDYDEIDRWEREITEYLNTEKIMEKVIVEILNDKPSYPTPYGKKYEAKGAYRQGKYIVVVGCLSPENTVRIKYPVSDLKLTFV